jgi:hypothetical protein
MYICKNIHLYIHIYIFIWVHLEIYIYIYIYIHICIGAYMHMCIHIWWCTHTYICVYTYMYIYIHTNGNAAQTIVAMMTFFLNLAELQIEADSMSLIGTAPTKDCMLSDIACIYNLIYIYRYV